MTDNGRHDDESTWLHPVSGLDPRDVIQGQGCSLQWCAPNKNSTSQKAEGAPMIALERLTLVVIELVRVVDTRNCCSCPVDIPWAGRASMGDIDG